MLKHTQNKCKLKMHKFYVTVLIITFLHNFEANKQRSCPNLQPIADFQIEKVTQLFKKEKK